MSHGSLFLHYKASSSAFLRQREVFKNGPATGDISVLFSDICSVHKLFSNSYQVLQECLPNKTEFTKKWESADLF